MLVTVYEVKRESQCKEKRFSIHMLTDYTYWFEEREQKVALFVRPERMRISEALQWQQGSFVEKKAGASHTSTEWRKVTRQDWEEYTFTSGHVPDEYVVEHRLAWMKERLAGRRLLLSKKCGGFVWMAG